MKANRLRVLAGGLIAFGALAGATPAMAGLTGSCGMVLAVPHNYAFGYIASNSSGYPNYVYLANPGDTRGVNLLAVIDFTNNTLSYSLTQVTIGDASTKTPNSYSSQNQSGVSFTTAAGPISGSYTITFTPNGYPSAMSLNILPVNSGNTYLVQGTSGKTGALTGVCQGL
ncbi:uncharacterized protein E1O_13020 [Burkholderiales bacterium GJ-E10]|nr:uncharacterized protein E1O_13020 [Burkholderiales bacterium GJ-E10]